MPRPPETPDVKASKGLAYILRHGAEKEGLHIRSDGYIKLDDVLARPKMRDIDVQMVLKIVSENSKQRFQLFYGYDPSPPLPKKLKKGQQPKKIRPSPPPQKAEGIPQEELKSDGLSQIPLQNGKGIDAAEIDNLQSNLSKTNIQDPGTGSGTGTGYVELPLISLDIPEAEMGIVEEQQQQTPKGEYFIRATQGHSINLEGTAHLEELKDDEEGRRKAGVMVHGTKFELWDILKSNGLSKMSRQHIHLAPSHSGQIVPRPNSTLHIYLSLSTLIQNNIPVYVSANGVVLTPGNQDGIVPKELWRKAVRINKGAREVIWENGKEIEGDGRVEKEGEEGI